MKAAAGLALALAAGGAAAFGGPEVLEAWLPSFLLWTQFAIGALGVLAIGHLLREEWLAPIRPPLEAMARSLPMLALMAVPVLVAVETLYPWAAPEAGPQQGSRALVLAPLAFRLRALGYLLLWAVLGRALARPGRHQRLSALTLILLLPSALLAAHDWVLSRDPAWLPSLQGFAIWVEGLAGALALAILAAWRTPPRAEGLPGLERALLTLALAVLWLWFTQFIVVWMADRPEESGWYLRRLGDWGWVQLGVALPALLLAISLAAPPDHGRWRMTAVCLLLLVQHVAHLWWVVRPDAPSGAPPPWLDLVVAGGLGFAWVVWWDAEHRRRPATA
ncbi:hypothetical protein [Siccirubricoccus deserti]|uniref:Quinol:cytochrome c oxidoreductase quinone-binding subunit 2 n=1 Tax=Siccirubricoccus deserti TaxID=2013562 RepID=A0A9X0UD20_9PROT|nr:hypothetical protein [Siccirubricoccus deserti]MBC4015894.1 hypothetical protein [Siccirubricoccus deserti]